MHESNSGTWGASAEWQKHFSVLLSPCLSSKPVSQLSQQNGDDIADNGLTGPWELVSAVS